MSFITKDKRSRLAQFASDNTAGVCPEAWESLTRANEGFASPYGTDTHTADAADAIREFFDSDAEVFFCFNGTAANSMSLAHVCRPFHSIIAHSSSHIENDECGGPEFFSHGSKLLLGGGPDGKLRPEDIRCIAQRRSDIHFPKPRVVSVTQSTELGTVYSQQELSDLSTAAHDLGLCVHMDGARLANALASGHATPAEMTHLAGVDVLCLGATKNGLPVGDAVVFFNRDLATDFDYRCKQAGQLASKMRFLTAPYAPLLRSGSYLRHAAHANACAARLAVQLGGLPDFRLIRPQQVNSAFFEVEASRLAFLRASGVLVHDFIGGGIRFMCSWATTEADLELLVDLARAPVPAN